MKAEEIVERIMSQHWDLAACMCWVCVSQHWDLAACMCWVCANGRIAGLRPREEYLHQVQYQPVVVGGQ